MVNIAILQALTSRTPVEKIINTELRLQRNELKCDVELHPDCGKKGKIGQQARQKFRPDPREAMWTKINRALRLAALEVNPQNHNL